jgi:hypothetical protein
VALENDFLDCYSINFSQNKSRELQNLLSEFESSMRTSMISYPWPLSGLDRYNTGIRKFISELDEVIEASDFSVMKGKVISAKLSDLENKLLPIFCSSPYSLKLDQTLASTLQTTRSSYNSFRTIEDAGFRPEQFFNYKATAVALKEILQQKSMSINQQSLKIFDIYKTELKDILVSEFDIQPDQQEQVLSSVKSFSQFISKRCQRFYSSGDYYSLTEDILKLRLIEYRLFASVPGHSFGKMGIISDLNKFLGDIEKIWNESMSKNNNWNSLHSKKVLDDSLARIGNFTECTKQILNLFVAPNSLNEVGQPTILGI